MTASDGPSPKVRNFSNTVLIEAILAWIVSSVSCGREASLPVGSPTLVVPPPIRTTGLCPACCRRRSIMIWIRLPTCRDGAVASKPM
ncbi:hypothetical protein D3C75_1306460 [compost metagenome]